MGKASEIRIDDGPCIHPEHENRQQWAQPQKWEQHDARIRASMMTQYLDFRADVIRHHTKHNSKCEGSQQKHGVEQNARNEVALIQQVDACSTLTLI